MPVHGDVGADRMVALALIVGSTIGYVVIRIIEDWLRHRAAVAERDRRAKLRSAIDEGRPGEHPEGELFNELFSMLADDQAEIATASNRLIRKHRGPACRDLVERPAEDARNLFDDIALRLDEKSFPDALATLAFILQLTARQVRALQQEEGFLPVFAYLFELRQTELDVASGRRVFRFDSYPAAIALLCDVRNGMRSELVGVLVRQQGPPRRRGRPRREESR